MKRMARHKLRLRAAVMLTSGLVHPGAAAIRSAGDKETCIVTIPRFSSPEPARSSNARMPSTRKNSLGTSAESRPALGFSNAPRFGETGIYAPHGAQLRPYSCHPNRAAVSRNRVVSFKHLSGLHDAGAKIRGVLLG